MPETPETTERLMLFIGTSFDAKLTKEYIWVLLPEDAVVQDQVPLVFTRRDYKYYKKPLAGYLRPGGIYKAKVVFEGNSTVVYGSPEYVATYWDTDLVVKLEIDDRSKKAELKARKEKDDEMRTSPLFLALEPIRIAYAQANSPLRREEILAIVIAYITRG